MMAGGSDAPGHVVPRRTGVRLCQTWRWLNGQMQLAATLMTARQAGPTRWHFTALQGDAQASLREIGPPARSDNRTGPPITGTPLGHRDAIRRAFATRAMDTASPWLPPSTW